MRIRRKLGILATASAMLLLAGATATASRTPTDPGPYELPAPALDISAAPDGSILVANGVSLTAIRHGELATINSLPLTEIPPGSPASGVNGVAALGAQHAYVTTGGADEAIDAGVWRVNRGQAQLIGDISAFEIANDPDVAAGWKHPDCEKDAFGGYTAGPQSNPYHVAATTDGALVADAAGNVLYAASEDAGLEVVAVFTPPVEEGEYLFLKADEVTGEQNCYVQPVPTSVAVGPDGSYYVGELTGALAAPGLPIGLSRVWKIAPGTRGATCSELTPDPACELLVGGLTSVIDVEFGPDGRLYVVEFDANSWLAPFISTVDVLGGSIKSCDVSDGSCTVTHEQLEFPGAITFDKWGDLWLLENNFFEPRVRRL